MSVTAMPTTPEGEAPVKKSKKKLIIILLVVLLAGGGGYVMFRPKPAVAAQPGIVVPLDPIQINLAAEHYLRVGIALQLNDKTKAADGSKALDALINEEGPREGARTPLREGGHERLLHRVRHPVTTL